MTELKLKEQGNGYSLGEIGALSCFAGKVFAKDVLNLTSMELSVGSLAAGEAVPFVHSHKQNEEVYFIISGQGVFTLDGKDVEVKEGDIIRITPMVKRTNKNTGSGAFVYLCVQAKENSLEQCVMSDAVVEQ